jgi:hypothetical protein
MEEVFSTFVMAIISDMGPGVEEEDSSYPCSPFNMMSSDVLE